MPRISSRRGKCDWRRVRSWLRCGCLLSAIVSGAAADAAGASFFVSPAGHDDQPGTELAPFKTIERAQAAVRDVVGTMADDVTVYLRGGTYVLSGTLQFDHRDSGQHRHRVIYRSYPGEQATLSGGRPLSGWVSAEGGLYRASAGGYQFRQLYVNGLRAIRARSPNAPDFERLIGWDEDARRLLMPLGGAVRPASWSSAELVILKQWTQDTLRVETVREQDGIGLVVPKEPDRSKAFAGHAFLRRADQSFYAENDRRYVDLPGEWYAQAGTDEVWYLPRAEESLPGATVIVPVLERLIDLHGTARDPIHDVVMMDLAFEYAGWTGPSQEGFVPIQADVLFSSTVLDNGRVPAAVHIEHAHGVRFERNHFRHLGGTALTLHTGITDVHVIGNRIEDVSGSGIVLDGLLQARPIDPRVPCRGNVIANNVIERIGLDYRSSVGIFAGFVAETAIEHNEIREVPYTGISVGWGWTDARTVLERNSISWNHIAFAMRTMADGAAIYTLSYQPGTVIHGNYIHDLVRSPWAGEAPIPAIYLDEGSSGMEVSDNVVERVPLGLFFHRASHNRIVNTPGEYEERWEATDNVIQQTPEYDPAAIKSQAGPEPDYASVRRLP